MNRLVEVFCATQRHQKKKKKKKKKKNETQTKVRMALEYRYIFLRMMSFCMREVKVAWF